jgi:predicted regulator of Ras-like GTPase activity (Roadblock/LC7/MglB family)
MVKQKNLQKTFGEFEPVAVETSAWESNVKPVLDEIKECEGVMGYILRNASMAVIDLDDSAKVTDFAMLSSSAFEVGEKLSELFGLGEIKNIIVVAKEVKTLHLRIDENSVSIFMDKNSEIESVMDKTRALMADNESFNYTHP